MPSEVTEDSLYKVTEPVFASKCVIIILRLSYMFLSAALFIIRLRTKLLCKIARVHIVVHWDYEIFKFTVFKRVRKIAESDY